MTIVHSIDVIAEWLEANVCSKIKLKPHSIDEQTDMYDYDLVNPSVFKFYVPTSSTKPPQIKATTPAICVQIVDGSDRVARKERRTRYRLSFSAWDPGLRAPDVFTPTTGSSEIGPPYERGSGQMLTLSHDGWRDLWNFVDIALREIETARSLGGFLLDPEQDISFGSFEENGALADYYPFWFAWVELGVIEQITRDNPAIYDLL